MKKKICLIVYAVVCVIMIVMIDMKYIPAMCLMLWVFSAGFALGSFNISNKEKLKKCTKYVCGTIVDVEEKHSSGKVKVSYFPIIEYAIDGKTYRTRYNMGRNQNYYKIGDDFWLFYDPNDPNVITQEDLEIESHSKMYAVVAIIAAIVSILLVLLTLFD